jgi:hypothetical protein
VEFAEVWWISGGAVLLIVVAAVPLKLAGQGGCQGQRCLSISDWHDAV